MHSEEQFKERVGYQQVDLHFCYVEPWFIVQILESIEVFYIYCRFADVSINLNTAV